MKRQRTSWNNWLLISGVILLAIIPLLAIRDSEFSGADGQAEAVIGDIQPEYEPWFEPLLAPPGGETESLLFALQAGIGAGTIGYAIGLYRGKSERNSTFK